MNLLRILGAIPFPRIHKPPATPTSLGDKALQNRIDPASNWTCPNHLAANVSDIFYRWINGIGPEDRIYRDRQNRLMGYGRKEK